MFRFASLLLICLFSISGYSCASAAQAAQEQSELSDAIRDAVGKVDSRIVNIQIWGAKQTKADLQTANHLTGVIVSDGNSEDDAEKRFIVTTLFGFDPAPSAILITDARGNRQSGKIVARDFLHKLVLLKTAPVPIGDPAAAPTVNAAAPKPLQRGQWVVACGRVFPVLSESNAESADKVSKFNVNVSIGILSATGRIGGLAIQTDAAVSPNNYGGPLLDWEGRILGILTPLSPEDESALAGFEWYDSGIGFAIPMETVERLLPRWKQGQDLYPGWAGFGVETKNPAIAEPISVGPPADSPAQKAGLIKGDRILALDGQNIATMAQGIRVLNRKFAGEDVTVVVERTKKSGDKSGDKRLKETLTLKITLERRPEKTKSAVEKPTISQANPESPIQPKQPKQPGSGRRNDD